MNHRVPVVCKGERVRAQEKFHQDAIHAARTAEQAAMQFRLLPPPKDSSRSGSGPGEGMRGGIGA